MSIKKIPAIILFIKVPHVGFVKTRLISESMTDHQACDLQVEMIKDTLLTLSLLALEFQPIISFYPENKGRTLKDLINSYAPTIAPSFLANILYLPQLGNTIGEHFLSTFKQVFDLPNINSCIILGGDTPHLHSSIISQAVNFLQMKTKTAVIGPSQDGGFYLFGLTEYIDHLEDAFSKINEFANLIELCSHFNFKIKILPFFFDLDVFQDVQSLFFIYKPLLKNKKDLYYNQEVMIPAYTLTYLETLFSRKFSI